MFVRLTPAERARLEEMCAERGLRLSDFVREAVNAYAIAKPGEPGALVAVDYAHLAQIGASLGDVLNEADDIRRRVRDAGALARERYDEAAAEGARAGADRMLSSMAGSYENLLVEIRAAAIALAALSEEVGDCRRAVAALEDRELLRLSRIGRVTSGGASD